MLHFFLLLMAKNFSKSSISIGQNCVLCTKSHAWRCSRVNFHDFNMRTLTHFQIELFSHCTYTFHDFVRYQLMFLTVCTTKTKKELKHITIDEFKLCFDEVYLCRFLSMIAFPWNGILWSFIILFHLHVANAGKWQFGYFRSEKMRRAWDE